jgi:hypothetical protein
MIDMTGRNGAFSFRLFFFRILFLAFIQKGSCFDWYVHIFFSRSVFVIAQYDGIKGNVFSEERLRTTGEWKKTTRIKKFLTF